VRGGRILVVGATGRVGGAAVRHLLVAGFEVRALVRSAGKGGRLSSLGAEPVVGDVTRPETLGPALAGCAAVFSALSAATERQAEEIEYRGNVNLLSAVRSSGASRFVYSSALLVDHPLARKVGTLREKARFEEVLLGADGVSSTVLRPVSCSWRPCSWRSRDPWPSSPDASGDRPAESPQTTLPSPRAGLSRGM
jgi:uncharacterized protein YbjT (DUF2867 family)